MSRAEVLRSRVWLTWETQRRNSELASAFRCNYRPYDYSGSNSRLVRYLRSTLETLQELWRNRYAIVFTQCPSVVLTMLIGIVRKVRVFRWVIDSHNCGVAAAFRSDILGMCIRWAFRTADFVIVSNAALANSLSKLRVKCLVLPDKLPELQPWDKPEWWPTDGTPVITFISSFASDEPVEIFLRAVQELREDRFLLIVTGSRKRAGSLLRFESENIRFTGFLPQSEFDYVIRHSTGVVDLTTRENCLVCGAYEALVAETPCIVSATAALKETFGYQGFLFAENNSASYSKNLTLLLHNAKTLREAMASAREAFEKRWHRDFYQVERSITGPTVSLLHGAVEVFRNGASSAEIANEAPQDMPKTETLAQNSVH